LSGVRSIRARLLIAFAGVSVLLSAGGGIALYRFVRAAVVDHFDERLRVQALAISTYTAQRRGVIDVEFNDRHMSEYEKEVATAFYQAWEIGGRTVARSDSLESHGFELPARFGSVAAPQIWDHVMPNGLPVRAIGISFVPYTPPALSAHENPELRAGLVVAVDRRPLLATLRTLAGQVLVAAFLACGLLCVAAAIVLRKGLAPLGRLAREVRALDPDRLDARFMAPDLPPEIGTIARALDELVDRVQRSIEEQRRFSADVAHELRTPVAELRTIAEVACAFRRGDAPALARALEDTLQIAQQMGSIVDRLLLLARSDAGQMPIAPERVELAPLVASLWAPLERKASLRGITPSFRVPPEHVLVTDRTLVGIVVSNLLANAVAHGSADGFVSVESTAGVGRVELRVANPAPDLEPEHLPHLFERFWRRSEARVGAEHSGLGLALVASLADGLGLELTTSLRDGVLTVKLAGPLAPPEAPAAS
jgi:signal transduction histidine kinase